MGRVIEAFAQFLDAAGDPLTSGWVKFLESETNDTLKATYVDEDLTLANENPLQLDAGGRCSSVFGSGAYRVVLYEDDNGSPGTQITSFDPVYAEYTGGELSAWEESSTTLRPVTTGQGGLGDATHLISDIYLEDEGKIYFGNSQDAYIEYDGGNDVFNFYVNSTAKMFNFNSYIWIDSDLGIYFGDSLQVSLIYDSTDGILELNGNEILNFEDNQFPGLTAKTSLADADTIVIEDSAASGAKKRVALSDLKTYVTS